MAPDAVSTLLETFWSTWNRRDWGALEALVTPDYVHHSMGQTTGWVGFRAGSEMWVTAFPDWQVTVESIAMDGARAVVRATCVGTHRGDFFGLLASGNSVRGPLTVTYRFADGRIAEDWEEGDMDGLLAQLRPAVAHG